MNTYRVPVLTLALMVGALAGCKGKDSASADSAMAMTSGGAAAPAPNVVTVTASDYAFDAPAEIPAGLTTIHLVTNGPDLHHAQLIRLDSGKTVSDLEQALTHPGPLPAWAVEAGGANAPDPGGHSNATLVLQPGNYALICMVDIPNGIPHFAKGMVRPLTVTPSGTATAALPQAGTVVTLNEYAFDISGPLSAGTDTIQVRNAGAQAHELELIQIAPGKSTQDVLAWFKDPKGPPPGHALGGVAALAHGESGSFTTELTPGKYLLVCLVPDVKDGKRHIAHGMLKEFTVS